MVQAAADTGAATMDAVQQAAEAAASVMVPDQQAIAATADAVRATQEVAAAGPDGTPVAFFLASAAIIYQWSESIKATPKVSGEPPSSKLPSFESLAAHAVKKSTAEEGKRNAWEIFTAGIVNLQKANYEGWNNGPPSPLYSNEDGALASSPAAPFTAVPNPPRPAQKGSPTTPAKTARPRMGA